MAIAAKKRAADSPRLDATAWTTTALSLLADSGIDGVRVEVLAKLLGVTKGSFYWHFKDRDALYEAMLSQWRRQATLQLIERLDQGTAAPEARLRRLLRLPIVGQRSASAADVELAIRLWGRRDARARAALEEVDQLRLRYIGRLLIDCGAPEKEATARAVIAYSYMRVAASLVPKSATDLLDKCESILIGRKSP